MNSKSADIVNNMAVAFPRKSAKRRSKYASCRLLIMLLLLLTPLPLFAAPSISLKVTGKWQEQLRANDLTGGAGSDFGSEYESDVDEVTITITKTAGDTAPWRIDIRKTDVNWNSNLSLWVIRSSDGTGNGTIPSNGPGSGKTYQEVTDTDQEFFTGTGDRSKIGFQYKIVGFSIDNLQVDTYETSVTITVTET